MSKATVTESSSLPSLYERLNRVKADIERVPKTGYNDHFKFPFATESDIMDLVRPLMAKHGLCCLYHGPDRKRVEIIEGRTNSGAPSWFYRIWVKYELVNTDDPTQRELIWAPGEALDTQDKGMNKALTAAAKYLMLRLFDISTGDKTEETDNASEVARPTEKKAPPAKNPAPKPVAVTVKVIGEAGAARVQDRAGSLELARKDVVNALLEQGHSALISGIWERVDQWPVEVLPILKTFFEDVETANAAYEKEKAAESDPMADLIKEIESRWETRMKGHKFLPGEPKNPAEMANSVVRENPHIPLKILIENIGLDQMIFPTGEVIPF